MLRAGKVPLERVGFEDFITRGLADVAKPSLKPSTYSLYAGIVRQSPDSRVQQPRGFEDPDRRDLASDSR